MGQHKHNPTAIAAKNKGIPPKEKGIPRREYEKALDEMIRRKMRETTCLPDTRILPKYSELITGEKK